MVLFCIGGYYFGSVDQERYVCLGNVTLIPVLIQVIRFMIQEYVCKIHGRVFGEVVDTMCVSVV